MDSDLKSSGNSYHLSPVLLAVNETYTKMLNYLILLFPQLKVVVPSRTEEQRVAFPIILKVKNKQYRNAIFENFAKFT